MLIEALAGATLALIAAEVWLLRLLRRAGAFARPIQAAALDTIAPTPDEPATYLRERVQREIQGQGEPGLSRSLAALHWLVEQFPPMDADPENPGASGGPARVDPQLFPHARRPHCGELAALLGDTLTALGIDHRRVVLRKNIFDPHDSHISVEAHCDGRWVLIDPTFNATFTDDAGQPLSAQDIKAHVFTGDRDAIRPTVHGRALCPLALGDYYVDLFACFNNVFVLDEPPLPAAALKLPLLHFFLGRKLFFEKLPDESIAHLRLWQQFYRAAALTLPLLVLGSTLTIGIAWAATH